jgi:hypothetical protein
VLVVRDPQRYKPPSSTPPGEKRARTTKVTYDVTHIGGRAIATVGTSPLVAVCGPLDACGLRGAVAAQSPPT